MDIGIETPSKRVLINSQGLGYYQFIHQLKPKYFLLWFHLLSGHAVLLLIAVTMVILGKKSTLGVLALSLIGGFLFGYTLAYIRLFFHEASHYNIAKDKKLNDLLANIFIGSLFGDDIKNYRPIHYGHHRFHGLPEDTENSYFNPLNNRFILESLSGIRVFNVLLNRRKRLESMGVVTPGSSKLQAQFFIGIFLNLLILTAAFFLRSWELGISWLIGLFFFFPFFLSIRQILEHRDEFAKKTINYFKVKHGIVNRLFGDGPLAGTLGGAGFNRHLLHHWEPKIPYTRLKEFENYLMDTPMAEILKKRQTTYVKTFRELFNR